MTGFRHRKPKGEQKAHRNRHQPEYPISCIRRVFKANVGIITIADKKNEIITTNIVAISTALVSVWIAACFPKKAPKPATATITMAMVRYIIPQNQTTQLNALRELVPRKFVYCLKKSAKAPLASSTCPRHWFATILPY